MKNKVIGVAIIHGERHEVVAQDACVLIDKNGLQFFEFEAEILIMENNNYIIGGM